jgi:hypothetical protein
MSTQKGDVASVESRVFVQSFRVNPVTVIGTITLYKTRPGIANISPEQIQTQ